jgi:hypothetical protein
MAIIPGHKLIPTPKLGFRAKNGMLCICRCVKGVIYLQLLPENTTLNAIMDHTQLKKLESFNKAC